MGKQNPKYTTTVQRMGFNDPDLKTPGHDQILFWVKENLDIIAGGMFEQPAPWQSEAIAEGRRNARDLVARRIAELEGWRAEVSDSKSPPHAPLNIAEWKARIAARAQQISDEIARLRALPELPDPAAPKLTWGRTVDECPISTVQRSDMIVGYLDTAVTFSVPKAIRARGGVHSTAREYRHEISEWTDPYWEVDDLKFHVGFEVKTSIPSYGELMRQLSTYRKYFGHRLAVVAPPSQFADAIREQGFYFVEFPGELLKTAPAQGTLGI